MMFTIAAWAMMAIGGTLAAPINDHEHTDQIGWTHEKVLEYRSLDSTDGWAGMSKVTFYNSTTPGEHIDFGLHKRSDSRTFLALQDDGANCPGLRAPFSKQL